MKLVSSPNCGNSPKMEFLKNVNIAFAKGDVNFLVESVTDDIVWEIIGEKRIVGKIDFAKKLESLKTVKATELVLHQILSHGKEGAVYGLMKIQKTKKYAFSDFYMFNRAKGEKIKSITSFCLEV